MENDLMEDLITREWNSLSVPERWYLRHKLNVKKYQQKNMEKNREKCREYYYRKKAEQSTKDAKNYALTLAKSNSIIGELINIPE